jgi:hypothetical protein
VQRHGSLVRGGGYGLEHTLLVSGSQRKGAHGIRKTPGV